MNVAFREKNSKCQLKQFFGTTRNHGLDFTTANFLRPNFTTAKHSLPTNEKQQHNLLFLTLEQQLPISRTHCSIVKHYTEHLGQSNNQFDQLIASVVTFYSIKSRRHVDGDTPTTMDTTRNECNGTVSTAIETGLVFLEMLITDMIDNNVAADLSNGADSAATAQENTCSMLVADKNVFGAENTYFEGLQHSKRYFGG